MDAIDDIQGSPMHVAIVIHNLHGGGAEFVARQWITELRAQGHRITIYVYGSRRPPVDLPPGVVIQRFTTRGGPIRLALLPVWLRISIRRDHPDVVLSLMTFSNVASLLALKICTGGMVPLVVSERNMQSLQVTNIRRRDRFMIWFARHLYRHANGVLAISHPVAGELVAAFGVPARRVFVVPNPVIPTSDRPAREARPVSKQLHLVLVGRQARQKRPHLFLAVLDELVRRGLDVRGTVIGDGPLRESTELEAKQTDLDVSFIGWREPWWEAVCDVDCLVLTANAEGFANVLIEAAAAGIPSVASSRALGVADAIVPGVTGELAMEDSPQAYANAVLSAAALDMTSDINIRGWLDHFSTGHSTATLLTALRAVMQHT